MIRSFNLLSNEFVPIRQLFNLLPQALSEQKKVCALNEEASKLSGKEGAQ